MDFLKHGLWGISDPTVGFNEIFTPSCGGSWQQASGRLPTARRQLAGACRQPAGRLPPDSGGHLPSSTEEADFGGNLRHKVRPEATRNPRHRNE